MLSGDQLWINRAFPEIFSHKAAVAPERQIKHFSLCTCSNHRYEHTLNEFMDSVTSTIHMSIFITEKNT